MKKLQDLINRRGFELTSKFWSLTFITTLILALSVFILTGNLASLWIFGVSMIVATLPLAVFNLYGIYMESGSELNLDILIGVFLFSVGGTLLMAPSIVLAQRNLWWLWLVLGPMIIGISLLMNSAITDLIESKKPR